MRTYCRARLHSWWSRWESGDSAVVCAIAQLLGRQPKVSLVKCPMNYGNRSSRVVTGVGAGLTPGRTEAKEWNYPCDDCSFWPGTSTAAISTTWRRLVTNFTCRLNQDALKAMAVAWAAFPRQTMFMMSQLRRYGIYNWTVFCFSRVRTTWRISRKSSQSPSDDFPGFTWNTIRHGNNQQIRVTL